MLKKAPRKIHFKPVSVNPGKKSGTQDHNRAFLAGKNPEHHFLFCQP